VNQVGYLIIRDGEKIKVLLNAITTTQQSDLIVTLNCNALVNFGNQ